MASQILASVSEKAQQAMSSEPNAKLAYLAQNTKDAHDKSYRITTDYGVKQTNTDDWLSVSNEDQQGPLLLEDSHGREKVRLYIF